MIGRDIHKFASELWPINRSLSGEGVRETLQRIKTRVPNLSIKHIESGTQVFDWVVPNEWVVNDAYIIDPNGNKICDYRENNLHLLGYSIPFFGELPLKKLKEHLYSLPDKPNAIPYVTSYYSPRWGFCISNDKMSKLPEGIYKIHVDTRLFRGVLNFGEVIIPGKKKAEILLSTYICHPSMANNELSGPVVQTFIAEWINQLPNREFTYRIIFVPETIGSIAYLSKNLEEMRNKIIAGFNLSCIGDERSYSYLPTRKGNTLSDKVAQHVLKHMDSNFNKFSWFDRGSDERQYCAPGVDLPVASIMRTMYGKYPEYHTSLDDLQNVVTPKGLNGGYWAVRKSIEAIEKNKTYVVTTLCEPQLGKRNLYPTLLTNSYEGDVKLMMDFISMCDGTIDLIDIANELQVPIWELYEMASKLEKSEILRTLAT